MSHSVLGQFLQHGVNVLEVLFGITDGHVLDVSMLDKAQVSIEVGPETAPTTVAQADVDKYSGNSDGYFRVFMTNPSMTGPYRGKLEVALSNGEHLSLVNDFIEVPSDVNTNLLEVPKTGIIPNILKRRHTVLQEEDVKHDGVPHERFDDPVLLDPENPEIK
jgi:hypothetical protein